MEQVGRNSWHKYSFKYCYTIHPHVHTHTPRAADIRRATRCCVQWRDEAVCDHMFAPEPPRLPRPAAEPSCCSNCSPRWRYAKDTDLHVQKRNLIQIRTRLQKYAQLFRCVLVCVPAILCVLLKPRASGCLSSIRIISPSFCCAARCSAVLPWRSVKLMSLPASSNASAASFCSVNTARCNGVWDNSTRTHTHDTSHHYCCRNRQTCYTCCCVCT